MNRKDIENMPAGEKMDCLIAVEVMGWKTWLTKRGDYNYIAWQRGKDGPWMGTRDWKTARQNYWEFDISEYDPMKHVLGDVPKFTRDISAAWQVVEKMASKGYYFELDYDLCAWTAVFTSADTGIKTSVNTTKSNAAEEICRCALIALLEPS
jgi:hypothetical protein